MKYLNNTYQGAVYNGHSASARERIDDLIVSMRFMEELIINSVSLLSYARSTLKRKGCIDSNSYYEIKRYAVDVRRRKEARKANIIKLEKLTINQINYC